MHLRLSPVLIACALVTAGAPVGARPGQHHRSRGISQVEADADDQIKGAVARIQDKVGGLADPVVYYRNVNEDAEFFVVAKADQAAPSRYFYILHKHNGAWGDVKQAAALPGDNAVAVVTPLP